MRRLRDTGNPYPHAPEVAIVRPCSNGILHPTALQWWGRQRDAMPLRWSLAGPGASVAINMALQKELFAASQLLAAV